MDAESKRSPSEAAATLGQALPAGSKAEAADEQRSASDGDKFSNVTERNVSESAAASVELAAPRGNAGEGELAGEQKPTFVQQIREKISAVKDKIVSESASSRAPVEEAEGEAAGEQKPSFVQQIKDKISTVKGKIVTHLENHTQKAPAMATKESTAPAEAPAREDARIPEGGLVMTANPQEAEAAVEEPQGLRGKIKHVFEFPVPDTTVTPTQDFEETVPPELKT